MNIIEALFKVNVKEVDEAKDKLHGLGGELPNVGQAIEGFIGKLKAVPGAVGLVVAAIAALALGVKSMIQSTLEAEEKLLDLSEAMGIPIERAQPFIATMELLGVKTEALQNSLGKLSTAVSTALSDPAGKTAEVFRKLGVSQDDLANGDIEQILRDTAAGFNEYADSAQKTAAMRELLGKQGPQIINEMQQEAELQAIVTATQREYGTAISENDAVAAKYFGVTLKQGLTMFEGVGIQLTRSLLPGLQVLVNQFADAGKQGGILRNVLDGLIATLSVVSKAIMTLLVEPVRVVVAIFKEAGTIIGGTLAAINAAAHGNFSEAKEIISQTSRDMAQIAIDTKNDMVEFETALWSTGETAQETGDKLEDSGLQFEGFSAAAKRTADTLAQLTATFNAQLRIEEAASDSLEDYKMAQDGVAVAAMRLKLQQDGATEAEIRHAEGLMLSTAALKQRTADEVAGWNIINRLTADNVGLSREQVQLQRELEEIARHPGMTQSQKAEANALAEKNAQLRQDARLKEEIAQLTAMVNRSTDRETASLRMGTNQLRLYNEELKLREQAEKLIAKDPANADGINKALEESLERLRQTNAELQQYRSSWDGLLGGVTKSMQDFATSATDLNKIGQDLATNFLEGTAEAFVKMRTEGKSAWKELGESLANYIQTVLVKFALLQGAILVMKAFGLSDATINTILGAGATESSLFGRKKSANGNVFEGGSMKQFAHGDVVSQRTFFDIGEMAEQGPEAIMPLARDGSGRLGVRTSGGGSSGGRGNTTHYHAPNITIVSNQDPYEIAKQTKRTLDMHDAATNRKIQKESRPGGMLRRGSFAFGGA